ncbi:MAG: hypothetical protein HDS50_03395 [Bacteroides sp.]|nr:hypothetical protein [Bacteroides sp.]
MSQRVYTNELEGQIDFFNTYLPRVDRTLDVSNIQNDYSDGVVKGNIVEFKLHIDSLNSTLFQTVKYLSSMRIKGKNIPRNIVLISLNDNKAFIYNSEDYLSDIEKVYIGGASRDNTAFVCGQPNETLDLDSQTDEERLITVLRTNEFTKIHIDENCIVGWATRYYRENPSATKSDFIGDTTGKVQIIGEIRRPTKFEQFILPYEKSSNEKFRYLMDRLNDFLQKKDLGAFYTHEFYAEKSLELVREAISRVPVGNDYVIIDRCAGTGNLERLMTTEELSHTIVSTLEYYEYKVLLEVLGDKVRHIIPPTEKEDSFHQGKVRGADALSKEYIENGIIRQYIDNPKCTIILFENPPYADTTSIEHQKHGAGKRSSEWKKSYVVEEMKKTVSGTATNDLGNAFIWSAFNYYLRQDTDSYIVYSPVKYWKAQHLINKEFIRGFAFNRKHFHTNIQACVMCALWSNKTDNSIKELKLEAFDIVDDKIQSCGTLDVKKINRSYSQKYFDKRKFSEDISGGILCEKNGLEKTTTNSIRVKPIFNTNIIGYMAVYSSGFDNPDNMSSLLTAARYDGNGFYLRTDNYLEKLPMFAASRYITYNREWTERARIMKSADGFERFNKDVAAGNLDNFLLKCLLFTILEPQNHMRSFIGSDSRRYSNQLTLDITNGETLAHRDISKLQLNGVEKALVEQWKKVLADAKLTNEYDETINYGLYQIRFELNTKTTDSDTGKEIYNYPSLNGNIKTLASMVKEYYNHEIVPVLFEYEFLK